MTQPYPAIAVLIVAADQHADKLNLSADADASDYGAAATRNEAAHWRSLAADARKEHDGLPRNKE